MPIYLLLNAVPVPVPISYIYSPAVSMKRGGEGEGVAADRRRQESGYSLWLSKECEPGYFEDIQQQERGGRSCSEEHWPVLNRDL